MDEIHRLTRVIARGLHLPYQGAARIFKTAVLQRRPSKDGLEKRRFREQRDAREAQGHLWCPGKVAARCQRRRVRRRVKRGPASVPATVNNLHTP